MLLCCRCVCSCAGLFNAAEQPDSAGAVALVASKDSSSGSRWTSSSQETTMSTGAHIMSDFLPKEVAASLLLQLFPCIQHPTAATAAGDSGFLAATTPPAAYQHSASSSSSRTAELAWLQQQLQLLVQPHMSARAAAAAGACRAYGSPCSPCCQAGFVVLRNLVALVIGDESRSLAADKGLARGELRSLALSSIRCMHLLAWCVLQHECLHKRHMF
jgi:hypothetical protein